MHATESKTIPAEANAAARRRLLSRPAEPLFIADWDRAVFLHYEVDAATLQREVPFPLDLHEGRAYVGLVAFTIRRMRLRFGGLLGEWLLRPIATHEFLNVRTYVRHRGEPGIFFLGEWLANRLSVRLGPRTFGLPYRLGRMNYEHAHETGSLKGTVSAVGTACRVRYETELAPGNGFEVCAEGSRDEFLLERYTAFTTHRRRHRFFRIWHSPWRQSPAPVITLEHSLVTQVWPWFAEAECVGANYSPGARDVWMGWPHRISGEELR